MSNKEYRDRIEAENKRAREQDEKNSSACSRLYVGKAVSWAGSTCGLLSCTDVTFYGEIVGIGSGNASAKIKESLHAGTVQERACSQFK